MGRVFAILAGVLVLALLAAGMTEVTLAIGHRGWTYDDTKLRPAGSTSPVASPTPKPSVQASVTPAATPTPTATPAAGPKAVTNSFVHLRADKSTSSNILTNLDGGTVLQVLPDSDAQWQQVNYNGITGYVFKSYLNYQ